MAGKSWRAAVAAPIRLSSRARCDQPGLGESHGRGPAAGAGRGSAVGLRPGVRSRTRTKAAVSSIRARQARVVGLGPRLGEQRRGPVEVPGIERVTGALVQPSRVTHPPIPPWMLVERGHRLIQPRDTASPRPSLVGSMAPSSWAATRPAKSGAACVPRSRARTAPAVVVGVD